MKQTFSENVVEQFKEYFIILENALNKDKSKEAEPKSEFIKSKESEQKLPSSRRKISKILSLVLGSALTIIGGASLFWLFKNKNKFSH